MSNKILEFQLKSKQTPVSTKKEIEKELERCRNLIAKNRRDLAYEYSTDAEKEYAALEITRLEALIVKITPQKPTKVQSSQPQVQPRPVQQKSNVSATVPVILEPKTPLECYKEKISQCGVSLIRSKKGIDGITFCQDKENIVQHFVAKEGFQVSEVVDLESNTPLVFKLSSGKYLIPVDIRQIDNSIILLPVGNCWETWMLIDAVTDIDYVIPQEPVFQSVEEPVKEQVIETLIRGSITEATSQKVPKQKTEAQRLRQIEKNKARRAKGLGRGARGKNEAK